MEDYILSFMLPAYVSIELRIRTKDNRLRTNKKIMTNQPTNRLEPLLNQQVNVAAREALWRLGHAPLFAPAILKQLATGELPDDRVQAADSIGE